MLKNKYFVKKGAIRSLYKKMKHGVVQVIHHSSSCWREKTFCDRYAVVLRGV